MKKIHLQNLCSDDFFWKKIREIINQGTNMMLKSVRKAEKFVKIGETVIKSKLEYNFYRKWIYDRLCQIAPLWKRKLQNIATLLNFRKNSRFLLCWSLVDVFFFVKGAVVQRYNPLTLKSEQSGWVGSRPGRTQPLESVMKRGHRLN